MTPKCGNLILCHEDHTVIGGLGMLITEFIDFVSVVDDWVDHTNPSFLIYIIDEHLSEPIFSSGSVLEECPVEALQLCFIFLQRSISIPKPEVASWLATLHDALATSSKNTIVWEFNPRGMRVFGYDEMFGGSLN